MISAWGNYSGLPYYEAQIPLGEVQTFWNGNVDTVLGGRSDSEMINADAVTSSPVSTASIQLAPLTTTGTSIMPGDNKSMVPVSMITGMSNSNVLIYGIGLLILALVVFDED